MPKAIGDTLGLGHGSAMAGRTLGRHLLCCGFLFFGFLTTLGLVLLSFIRYTLEEKAARLGELAIALRLLIMA